jgi:hypothetical protein
MNGNKRKYEKIMNDNSFKSNDESVNKEDYISQIEFNKIKFKQAEKDWSDLQVFIFLKILRN